MKKAWWKEAVVYQIYPKSFMDSDGDGYGDLGGIISKLDYLKKLGVDVIWLSPVYESPEVDNGYDISDYRAISPRYGTMEDFERLVAEAHKRDIKIVMDLVVNHTSNQHPWFVESRKSRSGAFRDYYIWRAGKDGLPPTNWGAVFGGSTWESDPGSDMYYLHLFAKEQPDLNWDNPNVREEIYAMMEWWCQKGIDGFRMDVISVISKTKEFEDGEVTEKGYGDFSPCCVHGPNIHNYLKEMNQKVLSKHQLLTVGETSGVTVEEAIKYANSDGSELNMVFQFEHMDLDGGESFKWNHRKIDLVELKQVLSKWQYGLHNKAWNSLYWCNHDQPRIVSRLGDDNEQYRELSAKMLASCLHMMQGTPYIYQGEELGMTNVPFGGIEDFRDLESINAYYEYGVNGAIPEDKMLDYVRYKSRDNARTPMQWDDTGNAGFTQGTPWIMVNPNYKFIHAKEQMEREDSVFHYYRKLINVRHEYPIIAYGDYQLLKENDPNIFCYKRRYEEKELLVICNFTGKTIQMALPDTAEKEHWRPLIHNYSEERYLQTEELQPYEAVVYLK